MLFTESYVGDDEQWFGDLGIRRKSTTKVAVADVLGPLLSPPLPGSSSAARTPWLNAALGTDEESGRIAQQRRCC